MASLTLRLFGSFRLVVQDKEVSGLSRASQRLAALLVLKQGTPLGRDWLAGTFWPEATQERALFYLRRSLTELRKAFGSQQHRLVSLPHSLLQLDLSGVVCDLIIFDTLIRQTGEEA